jgi:hypothetical protein
MERSDDGGNIALESRACADEAQMETEAHHLQRTRLEGELLDLRSAPVVAQTEP